MANKPGVPLGQLVNDEIRLVNKLLRKYKFIFEPIRSEELKCAKSGCKAWDFFIRSSSDLTALSLTKPLESVTGELEWPDFYFRMKVVQETKADLEKGLELLAVVTKVHNGRG